MMHMTFYWGKQVTVLFDSWKTQTWLDYALTLLACLLFSALYQFLENLRLQLIPSSSSAGIRTPLLAGHTAKLPAGTCARRAASAVLFGVNSALGYMIMLAVMSFNGGVLIAVVVGLSIGFFLFRAGSGGLPAESACACA